MIVRPLALLLLAPSCVSGAPQDETTLAKKPRVEWSLFHPLRPDPEVMQRYVEQADAFGIDGFEIAADTQGMDKVLLFEEFP